MTKEEFESKIWEYYLMLEENFYFTFKYVEPCDENNEVYSKEFGKLLLSIGSEVDVVCKELCKKIENKTSKEVSKYNMDNYRVIISRDNNFFNENSIFLKTNSGLYILCRVLYKKQFSQEPFPASVLFKMNDWAEYKEIAGNLLAVKRINGNTGFVIK